MLESNLQSSFAPSYHVEAAAMTTCGPARNENQDAIVFNGQVAQRSDTFMNKNTYLRTPFSVAVVDGMGGYAGGADAACLAAIALSKIDLDPDNPDEVDDYCNRLSGRILQAGHAWGTPEMGAAFAMLTIDGDKLTVANIGDCRVYRYDEAEDVLGLLSIDDRLANGSGGITQSLGGVAATLDAHSFTEELREESQYLLCSDGVWKTLDDEVLCGLLREHENASDVVCDIKRQCYVRGAHDNCSTIVVRLRAQAGRAAS